MARQQVILVNDDATPMEFVVWTLQDVFGSTHEEAVQLMLQTHLKGRTVCGTYPADEAQAKAQEVMAAARASGYPLQCVCEPTSG